MEGLLRFEHVEKKYGNGVHALKDTNLRIGSGEFVSIIGPSGSGKSTLLRSINRLIPITSGTIYLNEDNISDKKGKELREFRQKIGMVFQNYNLVERLSVLQNVLHGKLGAMNGISGVIGYYREEDKRKAIEILEELGLGDFIYNRASELSGGQKQRVGIARALMQEPLLLLCDEPIASLDPSSAKTIMEILYRMTSKRNITCIVNLHQIDVAKNYSTRIVGLSRGSIVFDGTPEELTEWKIEKIYGTSYENLMIGGEKGA